MWPSRKHARLGEGSEVRQIGEEDPANVEEADLEGVEGRELERELRCPASSKTIPLSEKLPLLRNGCLSIASRQTPHGPRPAPAYGAVGDAHSF